MIDIKTSDEINIMRVGGKILAGILKKSRLLAIPGVKRIDLDTEIEKMITDAGATPSFKNYRGYQYSSCLSINEEIVHSIPDAYRLKKGDILSIDIGVKYKGYHTDSAITFAIGTTTPENIELIKTTQRSLDAAIKKIKPGIKLGTIQKTIEKEVESKNLCLVRSFSGHGIGKNLQEDPIIPNYYGKNNNLVLKQGMVICIEPMVIIGKDYNVIIGPDTWTAISNSGNVSAHFEHTIAIIKNGAEVLTKL